MIRLVVLFTGGLDLYQVMQSLNLPSSMQFDHLLQRLSLRLLCSCSLEDLLTNKRLILGTQWNCRGQFDVRLNRQAIAQVLLQLVAQLDAQAVQTQEVAAYMAREVLQAAERDKTANKSSHTVRMSAKKEAFQGTAASASTPPCVRDPAAFARWWLHRIGLLLQYSPESSWTWTFDSLQEVLLGNLWICSVLSPDQFGWWKSALSNSGGLADAWMSAGESFREEFASSKYVRAMGSGGSTQSQGAASQSSLQSGQDSSLESSIASTFPFATTGSSPAHSVARPAQQTQQQCYDRAEPPEESADNPRVKTCEEQEDELLECYELFAKHLVGVHVVRIEAGTSGLTCVLEGWNLFSLLPRMSPSQLGRRTSFVRMASSASGGSASSGMGDEGTRVSRRTATNSRQMM